MTLLRVKPVVSRNLNVFNDFDRIFDEFFRPGAPAAAVRPAPAVRNLPAVNVLETGEGFRLELAAPGLSKPDFQITLDKEILSIEVHREVNETEGETYRRRDFAFNDFRRSFRLPETIDAGSISAEYANGILSVVLPKKDEAREKPARTIEIA